MGTLSLSRRVGESIFIEDIEVTVISIKGAYVKLAITAPDSVNIVRKEIRDKYSEKWKEREIQHGKDN